MMVSVSRHGLVVLILTFESISIVGINTFGTVLLITRALQIGHSQCASINHKSISLLVVQIPIILHHVMVKDLWSIPNSKEY